MAPFMPLISFKVSLLRARLREGGGDSDESDADGIGCAGLRDGAILEILGAFALDCRAVREEVREGAFVFGASMEACERLRDGMWRSGKGGE